MSVIIETAAVVPDFYQAQWPRQCFNRELLAREKEFRPAKERGLLSVRENRAQYVSLGMEYRNDLAEMEFRVPVVPANIDERLQAMTGQIDYPLVNDRMFRGLVSYSKKVRTELVRIFMGYGEGRPLTVEMMNPVSFGLGALEKETLEDIELLVDGNLQVNIELQDRPLFSNKPRFLLYLCRNYDSIGKGESYENLKASMQIGILNYAPVEKRPEFYAKYRLINVKTGEALFKDEDYFGLNVLDLTHTDLADGEDEKSGRVLLAKLFHAQTWEELLKLAADSSFAKEVAEYMYLSNVDDKERRAMEAHRRYMETQATIDAEFEKLRTEVIRAKAEKKEAMHQAEEADKRAEKEAQRVRELEEEVGKLRSLAGQNQ